MCELRLVIEITETKQNYLRVTDVNIYINEYKIAVDNIIIYSFRDDILNNKPMDVDSITILLQRPLF
jgi:hypothetical protein